MEKGEVEWGGSLHSTFRLLPLERQSRNLRPFLESHLFSPQQVLERLPYDSSRARGGQGQAPDPKRYRDGKQVFQTVGLLYEDANEIHVTDLGATTLRWLGLVNPANRVVLVRHAAYALAACQLRNPTGAGRKYAPFVEVFPFAFIWKAMLALDGWISSEELNRGLFRTTRQEDLEACIGQIQLARRTGDIEVLGPETIFDSPGGRSTKNDRIISWLSLASFGWTLFNDKGTDGVYRLDPVTLPVVRDASLIRHRHKDFDSVPDYVNHVSRCAALPKDLR